MATQRFSKYVDGFVVNYGVDQMLSDPFIWLEIIGEGYHMVFVTPSGDSHMYDMGSDPDYDVERYHFKVIEQDHMFDEFNRLGIQYETG